MWTSNRMIALYIALGVLAAAVIMWLVIRRTFHTRLKMAKALAADPDMDDWLIVFGWTPKVLYVPSIAVSLLASVLMLLQQGNIWPFARIDPGTLGGLWFTFVLLNFLVEEYNISIKVILAALVSVGLLLLWLHLLGWVAPFLGLFRHLAFSITATGYLLIAIIGLLTVAISWLRGLFYYITITPNYLGIQVSPTEGGEQIGREDYNTRIDTTDFLERLLGFGKLVITFKDGRRPPISLLVWRIGRKSELLERVRSKFAIDYPKAGPALPTASPPEPSPPPHEQPQTGEGGGRPESS